MKQPHYNIKQSINRHLAVGLCVVCALIFGLGGWAAYASISGALIASGTVVVESNVKKVQHRVGGIVGAILVENGDRVVAGDILLRLDDTIARANLAIITKQLDELMTRQSRLEAERNDDDAIKFPQELMRRQNQDHLTKAMNGETILFIARKNAKHSQKKQHQIRIGQFEKEVVGLTSQRGAKENEIELIAKELASLQKLFEQGHVPISRILSLQREQIRLVGEEGQLFAQIAKTHGQISETNLLRTQLDQVFLGDVVQELRSVQAKIVELKERRIAADDQLKRMEIRSPRSGYVHQLSVHTVGGVLNPGKTIALIVPEEDNLIVEARLDPAGIDQVQIGQSTSLRFSAFSQRTTPVLEGIVKTISADLSADTTTGQSYYVMRIKIEEAELNKLGNKFLLPGMPVEAFIQTAERSVMSYLLKPLSDQMMRSFREE